MRSLLTVCSSFFILMHVGPNLVVGAEFVPLGFGTSLNVLAPYMSVLDDGSVVGVDLFSESVSDIVRWTPDRGLHTILSGSFKTLTSSGDGSRIVTTRIDVDPWVPIMIENDVVTPLPLLNGMSSSSEAIAISKDGSTILGDGFGQSHFVRWKTDDLEAPPTLVRFPTWGGIQGISNDGSVFVGRLYRYSDEDGRQRLPGFSDGNSGEVRGTGISGDGRWTVGSIQMLDDQLTERKGVRWDRLSEPERLIPMNETWGSSGLDVMVDGTVVVGRLFLADDFEERSDLAAGIWTEHTNRMVPLQDLLISHYDLASSLEGYHLTGAYDITDDGRYIVGHMFNREGNGEAFFVDLGLRGDFDGNELLEGNDVDLLSAAIRSGENDLAFDVDYSNAVDSTDQAIWVRDLKKTYFGDANLDGEFNSTDLVAVFEAGQYEDAISQNSGWATGDWNGDAEFTTSDLVLAFQDGGYEDGPRMAVATVPEPYGLVSWGFFTVTFLLLRRAPP